ncbi:2OG-Fe(II) oxygenase family protein [Pseudoalteromonas distincta]|uniref:2OG-Fe(II) oxygenase family protein n=1 Tax=Pseudoalteromonas distincta TaxID=77608 RepID=UPI0039E762F8
MFELNKELNTTKLCNEYVLKNRILIHDILEEDSLNLITNTLRNEVNYLNAYSLNSQFIQSSDEELRRMTPSDKRDLQQTIYKNASNGIGFFYGRYEITKREENIVLNKLHSYLNSELLLSLIGEITGVKKLKSASVQLTRYIQGNFLTRHNDVLPSKQRAIAFVFGFTPEWHPDWGGLLHFYEQSGNLTETYVPSNNVLALFDVTLPHSVSYVTPFAKNSRYSITGWFNLS